MLIQCEIVQVLWRKVESWISEIGDLDYVIDDRNIIVGELQKSYWLNIIILNTKINIFNAKIDGRIPNIFSVKKKYRNYVQLQKIEI